MASKYQLCTSLQPIVDRTTMALHWRLHECLQSSPHYKGQAFVIPSCPLLTIPKLQDKEKGPPLMVQKTDGGFGYDTTDMACIRHRLNNEKGEWLIYVTDMGQAPHFEAIFAGAHKAGFIKQLPSGRMPRLDHVGFGVVLGEDGKRIATRSGEVSTQ